MGLILILSWAALGLLALALRSPALGLPVIGTGLVGYWLADRGHQPFAPGPLFVASWLAGSNLLFPTQVQITPTAAIRHRKTLIGYEEESINIAQIASVKIRTRLLWSDVIIESSGGTHPIVCSGHWNRDASAMQEQIEALQRAYFRQVEDRATRQASA